MQQLGVQTVVQFMKHGGLLKPYFYTCPICKQAIDKNPKRVGIHISRHVKAGLMPIGVESYIVMLLQNRRGVNQTINHLDDDRKSYVLKFVSDLKKDAAGTTDAIHNSCIHIK